MKFISLLASSMLVVLSSCTMPGVVSNPNNCFPQSVTETHTKTTLVAPPSYNMPYLPPSAIYQTAPVQAPQVMQAPACPQPMYQASPVCPPSQVYQSPQYQADPCAPYGTAPTNIRYNVVGTANSAQPQYIVVHPSPVSQPTALQLQAPKCEETH